MSSGVAPLRTYMLNFQAAEVNLPALERYLMDSYEILGFWNYIPFVYCFKSRLTPVEVAQKLRVFLPKQWFLVTEVHAWSMNGILPQAAWDWFTYDHANPPPPPQTPPNIAGLLSTFTPDPKKP